jgi:hypothetical protein
MNEIMLCMLETGVMFENHGASVESGGGVVGFISISCAVQKRPWRRVQSMPAALVMQ